MRRKSLDSTRWYLCRFLTVGTYYHSRILLLVGLVPSLQTLLAERIKAYATLQKVLVDFLGKCVGHVVATRWLNVYEARILCLWNIDDNIPCKHVDQSSLTHVDKPTAWFAWYVTDCTDKCIHFTDFSSIEAGLFKHDLMQQVNWLL